MWVDVILDLPDIALLVSGGVLAWWCALWGAPGARPRFLAARIVILTFLTASLLSQLVFRPVMGRDCRRGQLHYCAGIRLGEAGCAGIPFWAGHVDCL